MKISEISRGHEILLPNPNFMHYFVGGNPSKNYTIYIYIDLLLKFGKSPAKNYRSQMVPI